MKFCPASISARKLKTRQPWDVYFHCNYGQRVLEVMAPAGFESPTPKVDVRPSPIMEFTSSRAPPTRILHNAEESFCSKMGHTHSQLTFVLWLRISKLREGQSSVAGVLSP